MTLQGAVSNGGYLAAMYKRERLEMTSPQKTRLCIVASCPVGE
jgi:hypothetical protein